MEYRYARGPYDNIVAGEQSARKGEMITLTDEEVIDLTHRGIILQPIRERPHAPAVTEVEVVEQEDAVDETDEMRDSPLMWKDFEDVGF